MRKVSQVYGSAVLRVIQSLHLKKLFFKRLTERRSEMSTKPLVIYHADCTDGFGAAFAAWLELGEDAEYLPMQYGMLNLRDGEVFDPHKNYHKGHRFHPDNLAGRDVYILDFSFSRGTMEHLFANAARVVWLDHHKTAFEMWCPEHLPTPSFIDPAYEGYSHIHLDDNKSGALLAWEYFHPGTEVPLMFQLIDDRDRWQFKLKGSKELHAALVSCRPWSFEQWKEQFWSPYTGAAGYFEEELHTLYQEGAAILRAQDAAVTQAVKHARQCLIWGDDNGEGDWLAGLAVSCPLHQSEIGHELANKSGTFGLIWYMSNDGRINCSLRSNEDYDVSAIAKAFGGGGHRNAAGFQTSVETLMGWLK